MVGKLIKRYVYRANSRAYSLHFKNRDDSDFDLTGCTVSMTVKRRVEDTDDKALISKDVTVHTDATAGLTQIVLTSSDTNKQADNYVYDFQIKMANNSIQTLGIGEFVIKDRVTQR